MTRFSFSHCPDCGRLNIHGATCTCGRRTDLRRPTPAAHRGTTEQEDA